MSACGTAEMSTPGPALVGIVVGAGTWWLGAGAAGAATGIALATAMLCGFSSNWSP